MSANDVCINDQKNAGQGWNHSKVTLPNNIEIMIDGMKILVMYLI